MPNSNSTAVLSAFTVGEPRKAIDTGTSATSESETADYIEAEVGCSSRGLRDQKQPRQPHSKIGLPCLYLLETEGNSALSMLSFSSALLAVEATLLYG